MNDAALPAAPTSATRSVVFLLAGSDKGDQQRLVDRTFSPGADLCAHELDIPRYRQVVDDRGRLTHGPHPPCSKATSSGSRQRADCPAPVRLQRVGVSDRETKGSYSPCSTSRKPLLRYAPERWRALGFAVRSERTSRTVLGCTRSHLQVSLVVAAALTAACSAGPALRSLNHGPPQWRPPASAPTGPPTMGMLRRPESTLGPPSCCHRDQPGPRLPSTGTSTASRLSPTGGSWQRPRTTPST